MNEHSPCSSPLFCDPNRWPATLHRQDYIDRTSTLHTGTNDPRFTQHESCIRSYFTLYVTSRLYDQCYIDSNSPLYIDTMIHVLHDTSYASTHNLQFTSHLPVQHNDQKFHSHTVPQLLRQSFRATSSHLYITEIFLSFIVPNTTIHPIEPRSHTNLVT